MDADVVIIGCGPAGLQAGIHSSRKKAETVLVGKTANSALFDALVENYFGVNEKADGSILLKKGLKQAMAFGCGYLDQNVVSAVPDNNGFKITVESGEAIRCKSVILAMGISRKKLNIPGEKEFLGKGVSYCAECDCNFYKDKKVAIIGDESQAATSAILMSQYASDVFWITEMPLVHKDLVKKVKASGVMIIAASPKEIKGNKEVTSLLLSDRELQVDGVFIELGGKTSSDIAMDLGVMPETDGSIKINSNGETSVPGIYACGDITGKPWQLAKAVGDGAVAGLSAAEYSKEAPNDGR